MGDVCLTVSLNFQYHDIPIFKNIMFEVRMEAHWAFWVPMVQANCGAKVHCGLNVVNDGIEWHPKVQLGTLMNHQIPFNDNGERTPSNDCRPKTAQSRDLQNT